MKLKKKIILSNILMVVLPVLLILAVWTGYVHFHSGTYLKPISRASGEEDRLTDAMNILHTLEAELSEMHWDMVSFAGEDGPEIVLSPEKERIEELNSLGFHLQVETAEAVSFTNMDETDRKALDGTGTRADGAIFWVGDSLVIEDSFKVSGLEYYLTAVYNGSRADQGVQSSLLPMYMVSPTFIVVFLVIAAACIALVSALVSRWMNRSVLVPLEELKKGADKIAEDDLDYRIPYAGQDEFGEVCSEFDRMRRQLKEAKEEQKRYEEERRALLRGISHDLRSPLTSIKGYAQGLKDGIADTEEKRQRYCNAILTRADDMERLTGSLSLLVKLENDSRVLNPEKVCLDEYIRQLLSEKEAWLSEQKIEVEYQTDSETAEVCLDIREMQRVFMNLFENTARYRKKDRSKVQIEVHTTADAASRAARGVPGEAEIRFADDGPGVAPEHIRHIFESFYRADEARTDPGSGSGIGLSVVKQIIEGQGGRIRAYSENGLCIVMTLPLAQKKGERT